MKIHSLTIAHYGKDYLSYALRSVYEQVDRLHIFYTPTPSHGHTTNIPPIEKKEDLQQVAYAYDPQDKIAWYDMQNIRYEGQQRDLALQTIVNAGADIVIVIDYDEIWSTDILTANLQKVIAANSARNWLVNMTHFWRSFNWVCNDHAWPVRIIDLRRFNGTEYIDTGGKVYHFGYAITDRVMNYKWQIHGHKAELRGNWFKDKWAQWPPPDNCHPTNGRNDEGVPFWTPEPFNKKLLPALMHEHPFWGLDKIE